MQVRLRISQLALRWSLASSVRLVKGFSARIHTVCTDKKAACKQELAASAAEIDFEVASEFEFSRCGYNIHHLLSLAKSCEQTFVASPKCHPQCWSKLKNFLTEAVAS